MYIVNFEHVIFGWCKPDLWEILVERLTSLKVYITLSCSVLLWHLFRKSSLLLINSVVQGVIISLFCFYCIPYLNWFMNFGKFIEVHRSFLKIFSNPEDLFNRCFFLILLMFFCNFHSPFVLMIINVPSLSPRLIRISGFSARFFKRNHSFFR